MARRSPLLPKATGRTASGLQEAEAKLKPASGVGRRAGRKRGDVDVPTARRLDQKADAPVGSNARAAEVDIIRGEDLERAQDLQRVGIRNARRRVLRAQRYVAVEEDQHQLGLLV